MLVAVISSFVLVGLIALVFHVVSKMIGWCMARSRSRRGRRSHLGIIFYRDTGGDRVGIIEEEIGQRQSHSGAFLDETSPLLRANNQGING